MIQPNPYLYSTWVPSCTPKKMKKKLSGRFWEINILSEKLTMDDDNGRRRQTNWHKKSFAAIRLAELTKMMLNS